MAIVAAFAATRNLKDQNLRKSIITKITKQYLKAQKSIDKNTIFLLAYYATGGIPSDLSYEELKSVVDAASSNVISYNDDVKDLTDYKKLSPKNRVAFRSQGTISTKRGKTAPLQRAESFDYDLPKTSGSLKSGINFQNY